MYREKEITKRVRSNVITSMKLLDRTNTIFINPKNSKTSGPHRLSLSLADKIDLKSNKCNKYVALSNFSIYYTWKN